MSENLSNEKVRKSWSRELAFALLLFLGYLSLVDNKVEELRTLTPPFVAFAVMAYGFKQPGVEKWLSK